MGETVSFASNGGTANGYCATPASGSGPGVLVIQEWWGLVPHIKEVCDRLAGEGFTALAPDLYHGRTVPNAEPDDAAKAAMALDIDQAARDMTGAVDFLIGHEAVRGHGIGVIGFCMGAGLALWLATLRPDAVQAVVPFYGLAPRDREPDWARLEAAVEGHFAELDQRADPQAVDAFEEKLTLLGKEVRVFVYPNTQHAFFNDTRPEVHDPEAARQAWVRTLEFLRAKLG